MKTSSTTTAASSILSLSPPPYRLVFEPRTTSSTPLSISPAECCCSPTIVLKGVVLMLHGWAQNVHVFSNRSKKLTKRLTKAGYRVVFLQAPHRLPTLVATEKQKKNSCDSDKISNNIDSCGSVSSSRQYAYAWFFYDNNESNDTHKNDGIIRTLATGHEYKIDDGDVINSTSISTSISSVVSATAIAAEPILLPSPTGNYRGMERSLKLIHEEIKTVRNEGKNMNKIVYKNNKYDDDDDDDADEDEDDYDQKSDNQEQKEDDKIIPSPVFILGFSQGAVLVHKIATLACKDDNDNDDISVKSSVDTETKPKLTPTSSMPSNNNDNGECEGQRYIRMDHYNYCWKYVRKCILVSGFSFTTSIAETTTEKSATIDNTDNSCGGCISSCNEDWSTDIDDNDNDKKRKTTTKIIPSMHVVGDKDYRVRPYLTREVYLREPCFGCGTGIIWEHHRGHVLPQDRGFCNRVLEFLAAPPTN